MYLLPLLSISISLLTTHALPIPIPIPIPRARADTSNRFITVCANPVLSASPAAWSDPASGCKAARFTPGQCATLDGKAGAVDARGFDCTLFVDAGCFIL
ncbi:hypothetical protein F4810DRAFT_707790 [Camillea tinctor]|nr:hypothetical protein F4810DRAFT_707790 [Camillea tinctor]